MRNIDPHDVSEFVANIKVGKFREQVPENLARSLWARQNGDNVTGIPVMAGRLWLRTAFEGSTAEEWRDA